MYWETRSISRSATCWTCSPGRGRSATNSLRGACTASLRSKSIPYTITSSKNGRRPGNRQSVRRQSQCIPLPKSCAKQFDLDLFGRALRSGGQRRGHPAGTGTRFTQTGWVSRFRTFEKHKFFRPTLTFGNQEVTEACNFLSSKSEKKVWRYRFLYYLCIRNQQTVW